MSVLFDVETDELQRRTHALFLASDCGLDERIEKRMRRERTGFEFGMKLRTEHKGVRAFGQLGYLHEAAVGRFTGKYETRILEALDVLGIYLEAVAVALANELRAASFELRGRCVGLLCYGAGDELARIRTQAHGAAVIFLCEFFYLLRKNCDDGMRTLLVYLGRMGAREACDIARIFDGHELHAIAEPEV